VGNECSPGKKPQAFLPLIRPVFFRTCNRKNSGASKGKKKTLAREKERRATQAHKSEKWRGSAGQASNSFCLGRSSLCFPQGNVLKNAGSKRIPGGGRTGRRKTPAEYEALNPAKRGTTKKKLNSPTSSPAAALPPQKEGKTSKTRRRGRRNGTRCDGKNRSMTRKKKEESKQGVQGLKPPLACRFPAGA